MRRENLRIFFGFLFLVLQSRPWALWGSSSDQVQILEEFPKNALVDGQLGEWQASPTLLLNSSKVWIAVNIEGLLIAGHVENASTSTTSVEFWLSLPSAEMPPIAT